MAEAQPTPSFAGDLALEAGAPFIHDFGAYAGAGQVYALAQNERGVMFVGTNVTVSTFDGARWRPIRDSRERGFGRIVTASGGDLFTVGSGHAGRLVPDSTGQLGYRPLPLSLPDTPDADPDVADLVVRDRLLYVLTSRGLFTAPAPSGVPGDGIELDLLSRTTVALFEAPDEAWALDSLLGLQRLDSGRLRALAHSERLAGKWIAFVDRLKDGRLLVGLRDGVLLAHDGQDFQAFAPAAETFLRQQIVRDGVVLRDGNVAVGTERSGVALLGRDGRLLRVWDTRLGLPDAFVQSLFEDRRGGLWIGMNTALARAEVATPVTRFDYDPEIRSSVSATHRAGTSLYITTPTGLYRLIPGAGPGGAPALRNVPGLRGFGGSMAATGSLLLVGADRLYSVEGERAVPVPFVRTGDGIVDFERSQTDPGVTYVGLYRRGIMRLARRVERWEEGGRINIEGFRLGQMAEDEHGGLWVGTREGTILHLPQPAAGEPVRQIDGPPGQSGAYRVDGRILFATVEGLRRLDRSGRLVPDSTFGPIPAHTPLELIAEGPAGEVWIRAAKDDSTQFWRFAPIPEGGYERLVDPVLGRLHRLLEETWDVNADAADSGVVWLSTASDLLRYDTRRTSAAPPVPAPIISAVLRDDVLLYGGAVPQDTWIAVDGGQSRHRFEFSLPAFDVAEGIAYQVRLEGRDREWSPWTTQPWQEYTDLSRGRYSFRLRARDAFGTVSAETSFALAVRPRWFETWWFISVGVLLFAFAGPLVYRYRVRRLEARAHQLEQVVAQRTDELRTQKEQIEEQAHRLVALDHMKSRFFANISHEFRTPLTLTLGPLEDLLQDPDDPYREAHLRMHRNAQRLLRLINQLLDLSRLESGALILRPRTYDLAGFLRRLTGAFDGLAQSRRIKLRIELVEESVPHVFDADRIEKVLLNLLSNAFKFTREGGTITVSLRRAEDGSVLVTVRDTGVGIAPDHLPRLFDRFYQADDTVTRRHEGSGIGLTLAKELVELHGGTLSVESTPGAGSSFAFTLPVRPAEAPPPARSDGEENAPAQSATAGLLAEAHASPAPAATSSGEPVSEEATVVLVVEDNPDMRAYVRAQLEGSYTIVEAENGKAGLERAFELVPDLVLSDVMMPEMDGFALCNALREDARTSHIPVILLTAKADTESRVMGFETGADAYLPKPFNAQELRVRVKHLIDGRRNLRERYAGRVLVMGASDVALPSMEAAFLDGVRASVETHLGDFDFSVLAMAETANMSERQLRRKLKALTGESPNELVRRMRLERAEQLLRQRAMGVKEVAGAVGFRSTTHFIQLFHETYGAPPAAYAGQGEDPAA